MLDYTRDIQAVLRADPDDTSQLKVVQTPHAFPALFHRRPSVSTLPQELIDIIVDYLVNSPADLAVCAFVGKAWVASSRSRLFCDIHLHPYDFEHLDDTLAILDSVLSSQFTVHSLTLSVSPRKAADFPKSSKVLVDASFMTAVLRKLPRLRTITFDRCTISLPVDDFSRPEWPHSGLSSLHNLFIIPHMERDFRADIATTLVFFHKTRTHQLDIYCPDISACKYDPLCLLNLGMIWRFGPAFSLGAKHTDALGRWEVDVIQTNVPWLLVGIKEIVSCILSSSRSPFLHLGRLTSLCSPVADEFWIQVGPKIKHLRLEVEYKVDALGVNESDRWRNLRHCDSLQTITLAVDPCRTLALGYQNMLDVLAHAPMSIRRLVCELQVRAVEDVSLPKWAERIDWPLFQETVTRFKDLKAISFLVRRSGIAQHQNLDIFCQHIEKIIAHRIPVLYLAIKTDIGVLERD